MFVIADVKWGTPELGESGGIVQWNADLSTGLNYDEDLYDQEDFDEALRDAFEAWEDVADINFVESLTDSEITVEMGALEGDIIGLAELTFVQLPETDQFIEADITLDSTEEWSPQGETGLSFYAVAVHEIGHALGLLHVDDDEQIMNEFLIADDLGEGDIDGAQAIYGEAPIPVFDAEDNSATSFFERFFEILLSIFGIGGSTTAAAKTPAPWAETDGIDLADLIPITEILDENGEPFEEVTVTHYVPHPEAEEWEHPPGCQCGCAAGHDHQEEPLVI